MIASYVAVVGAAVLWAAAAALASAMFDAGASVVEITEARSWIALTLLALVEGIIALTARRSKRDLVTRPRAHLGWFVALGASLALVNLSYYKAISLLPVAIAIVIQYTAPALIVLWFVIRNRRLPTKWVMGGLVGATLGVGLLALTSSTESGPTKLDPLGLVLAAFAALTFATYTIISSQMSKTIGARKTLLGGFAVSSLIWLAIQVPNGVPQTLVNSKFVGGVLILGTFGTVIPFYLFVGAMRRLDPQRAGIVSMAEPVAAAIIAWITLGQSLSVAQLIGGALVIVAIGVVQSEKAPSTVPV